jgi:membrane-bound lytic murein transglycosylase D
MSWVRHLVKSGETLRQIAGKYGVNTQAIRDIKSNNIRRNLVHAGDILLIPVPSEKYRKEWAEQEKKELYLSPEEGRRVVYTVRRGDTLSEIARKFGVSISNLRKWNGLGNRSLIRTGQKLRIYNPRQSSSHKTYSSITHSLKSMDIPTVYRVKAGESLWSIANKYGLSLKELKELNNLGSESIIRPGDELILSKGRSRASASEGEFLEYTVKKGDTLWSIASEFGVRVNDLKEENGLYGNAVIKVGDKLRIPK